MEQGSDGPFDDQPYLYLVPDDGTEAAPDGDAPLTYDIALVDSELIREQPGEEGNPSPFALPPLDEMPPKDQATWLLEAAIITATSGSPEASLDARLKATGLLPENTAAAEAVFEEVMALDPTRIDRTLALAEIARQPGEHRREAWDAAVDSAMQIGRLPSPTHYHLLEMVAEGQADRKMLHEAALASRSVYTEGVELNPEAVTRLMRARILKTVVKAQADAGLAKDALATFMEMRPDNGLVYRDEAAIHIAEASLRHYAHNGPRANEYYHRGQDLIHGIQTHHLQPWGQIKLAKYLPGFAEHEMEWIDTELEEGWANLKDDQRIGIINDLAGMGEFNRASAWARRIAHPRLATAEERRLQTDTIVDVALQQARAGDVYAPSFELRQARLGTNDRLHALIEQSRLLYKDKDTTKPNYKAQANRDAILEFADRSNMLLIYGIAIGVHGDTPDTAIAEMYNAGFAGTEPHLYQNRARAILAEELAHAGHIGRAAQIASEIPDDNDPEAMKAHAFIRIATALQPRRSVES